MEFVCNSKNLSFNEILSDKEKYAELFCEGSNDLKQCLLLLWNNNIETVGCCKGHKDENKISYIGINLDSNLDKIVKLLSSISKEEIVISFVLSNNHRHCSIKQLNIKSDYNIFKTIMKCEFNDNSNKLINEVINYIMNNENEYLNIHIHYKNNEYKIYLITTDESLIKELKQKYEYKILNEKINLYHFILK